MSSESHDLWKDHNALSQPGSAHISGGPLGTRRGTPVELVLSRACERLANGLSDNCVGRTPEASRAGQHFGFVAVGADRCPLLHPLKRPTEQEPGATPARLAVRRHCPVM